MTDGQDAEIDAMRRLPEPPPVVIGPLTVIDEPHEQTPAPSPTPHRRPAIRPHHEDGSRELMLGWCLWLLASWIMLGMGFNGTPIRQMIFASCIGMMIAWPAYRLSQSGRRWAGEREQETGNRGQETGNRLQGTEGIDSPPPSIRNPQSTIRHPPSLLTPGLIFRDWFALNGVFQAVIWPHLITRHWTLPQAAWVSGSVAAWSLLIGAIVAWGCQRMTGLSRSAAMLLVLAMLFVEPVVLMIVRQLSPPSHLNGHALNWSMHVSPIEAIHALTVPSVQFSADGWRWPVGCVALAAVMAWTMVIRGARRPGSSFAKANG